MQNTTTPLAIDSIAADYEKKLAQKAEETTTTNSIEPQKLLNALYWIMDVFERSNMPFFLIGSTAEQAINGSELTGDRVTIGLRQMEWNGGSQRILTTIAPPVSEDGDIIMFEHEGVPVEMRLFEDSSYITGLDSIHYRYEYFKIPNPYKEFKEKYE